MAATVQTLYYTGAAAGTVSGDMTSGTVRFKRADNHTVDNNNPIPLPTSGEAFSWRKHSKVNATTSPTGSITNLRWFATTPGAGINLYAWTNSAYTQGSSADESGITGYTDAGNKATNLVGASNRSSTNPLVVNAGTVLSNPSTGLGTQDYVISQMSVASTYAGGPGAVTGISVTYRYNET